MSVPLYLHLKNGRVIHVTNDWNGAAPTQEDTAEQSEPYRDIFRVQMTGTAPINTAQPQTGVLPGLGQVASVATGVPLVSSVAATISGSQSDESAHVAPRQFAKSVTWLIFVDATAAPGGGTYKVRKAAVDTWSTKPPID